MEAIIAEPTSAPTPWSGSVRNIEASTRPATAQQEVGRLTGEQRTASARAVDLHQVCQHPRLLVHPGEHIFRVASGSLDPSVELLLELGCRALDDLEVGEHATGSKAHGNLGEQRLLAFVGQVVDGEPRDDDVEGPEIGQRGLEVVLRDGDAQIVDEAVPGALDHRR
jgi:hypothetical protein